MFIYTCLTCCVLIFTTVHHQVKRCLNKGQMVCENDKDLTLTSYCLTFPHSLNVFDFHIYTSKSITHKTRKIFKTLCPQPYAHFLKQGAIFLEIFGIVSKIRQEIHSASRDLTRFQASSFNSLGEIMLTEPKAICPVCDINICKRI